MDRKDKIDALKFLSETHRSQFNERRKYEWNIIFTTLTFYVLCVPAVFAIPIHLLGALFAITSVVILIVFIILDWTIINFLQNLHTANNINKEIAQIAEDKILELIAKDRTDEDIFQDIKPIKPIKIHGGLRNKNPIHAQTIFVI